MVHCHCTVSLYTVTVHCTLYIVHAHRPYCHYLLSLYTVIWHCTLSLHTAHCHCTLSLHTVTVLVTWHQSKNSHDGSCRTDRLTHCHA